MTADTPSSADRTPTSTPVLKAALRWGGLFAAIILVVGAVVGWFVAEWTGVVSALIGTGIAVVFMGITAASILLANRFANSEAFIGAFFGIVLGGWLVKLIVFVVIVLVLRGQPWLHPMVLFLSVVAGVVASLAADVIAMTRSRVPYTDARLPKPPEDV
ncbi:hypothetical protein [Agromyces archimandritae]|uniref:Uncharacterized protein n=1 Tax=Agromyces archimandritae TaxID=2781962 RepID=A0A975FN13_9MICO|nr:hypothetical protein [Agromyces archimandritae]QTX05155.1 hypothetical protein G127AT_02675 [Agromyces archimandritae]